MMLGEWTWDWEPASLARAPPAVLRSELPTNHESGSPVMLKILGKNLRFGLKGSLATRIPRP